MAADDHGDMNETDVTDWEEGVSVNADNDNWYVSLAGAPNGYDWRDGNQWSDTPVSGGGLPSGDIAQFGIAWLHTGNNHYGAVDNFIVSGVGNAKIYRQPPNGPDYYVFGGQGEFSNSFIFVFSSV